MHKIASLFQRNDDTDHLVRDELVSGAEWVALGEGVATQKWDGTCCLVRSGRLYRRHEVKPGKTTPPWFEAVEQDERTGAVIGWIPVGDSPQDQWHRDAFDATLPDGTYELCGPKVQGNPEGLPQHGLLRHGAIVLEDAPRTFAALKTYFATHPIEGIVWHHPDGRMVKIKARDFGLRRGIAMP